MDVTNTKTPRVFDLRGNLTKSLVWAIFAFFLLLTVQGAYADIGSITAANNTVFWLTLDDRNTSGTTMIDSAGNLNFTIPGS